MKRHLLHLLPALVTTVAFCAAATADDPRVPLEDKAFVKCGAAIQFPKGWTLVEVPGAQAYVFARAPEPDADDARDFYANININRTAAPQEDLLKLAREFQNAHKSVYPDYAATVTPAELTINGNKAVVFGGTFTTRGLKMRNQQWFVAGSDRGYWITLTALGAAWEKHAPSGDASVHTFRLVSDESAQK